MMTTKQADRIIKQGKPVILYQRPDGTMGAWKPTDELQTVGFDICAILASMLRDGLRAEIVLVDSGS